MLLFLLTQLFLGFCVHPKALHLSSRPKTLHLSSGPPSHAPRNLQTLTRNKMRMTINTIALNTVGSGTTS